MQRKKSSKEYEDFLDIPEGVTVKVDKAMITAAGKTTDSRYFPSKIVNLSVEGNKLKFSADKDNKKVRKMIGTIKAHTKNMFKGITKGHTYKLKICSGHFPMNVSVSKDELIVKNLLGEKIPRVMKINENAKVRVEGDYVIVESSSKDIAGQTAAMIEGLTKRVNYDRRIFQDGIYIIDKDGKEV